jgi:hypothetical protein
VVDDPPLQVPELQVWPVVQVFPQLPQFEVLVCRLTQVVPHIVWPLGQVHVPFEQLPEAQVFPQLPQLVALVCRLTQLDPQ